MSWSRINRTKHQDQKRVAADDDEGKRRRFFLFSLLLMTTTTTVFCNSLLMMMIEWEISFSDNHFSFESVIMIMMMIILNVMWTPGMDSYRFLSIYKLISRGKRRIENLTDWHDDHQKDSQWLPSKGFFNHVLSTHSLSGSPAPILSLSPPIFNL